MDTLGTPVNQYDTLTEATQGLKERGFTAEFSVNEAFRLIDHDGDPNGTEPEQVKVLEFHRYEGESDPNDMTIIYALQTPSGSRGVLIDAFGTYSDEKVDEFVKRLDLKSDTQIPQS